MSQADQTRSDTATETGAPAPGQTLTLAKGRHRWTFSYGVGEEAGVLSAISELAARDGTPFDWFDAALVSHQVARRLRPGIDRVDTNETTPRGQNGV